MRALAAVIALVAGSAALAAYGAEPSAPQSLSYLPQRVFNTKTGAWTDFETMAADIAGADMVFVGEQHGDPNTHALERALLEAIARRRPGVIVSMEFFERDTQAVLDRYLAGTIDEAVFVKDGRAPSRYQTDYKPIIELAKERKWPVIAANVPRLMAGAVAKNGLDELKTIAGEQKAWLPAEMNCPLDTYYERFVKAMGGHPGSATDADQKNIRYYYAQCLKDEAMGESVARAVKPAGALVVHFNGTFHSDFGLGTAERARRRVPNARAAVVSVLPVASLDGLAPAGEDLRRADYLIYTLTSKRPQ